MKKLLAYLKPYRKECVTAPAFKCLEALMDLFVPLCMASLVDQGIAHQDVPYIRRILLILIALALLGAAFAVTAQYFSARAATGFAADVRHALFSHIQSLSFSKADEAGSSTLITRLSADVNQLQTGVNMTLRLLLRSPFIVFGSMIMALRVDAKASLVFVAVIPLLSLVVYGIMALTMPRYKKVQQQLDVITRQTRENLTGVRVIRAFRHEEQEVRAFHEANETLTDSSIQVSSLSALTNPLTYVLINLALVFLLHICGIQVNAGRLTQGQVIALANYMAQVLVELLKLANLIVTMSRSAASASRVQQVLDLHSEIESGDRVYPAPKDPSSPHGALVSFDHVSFTYQDGALPALSDISFTACPGETIGIIGGTGSGKSTLVELIPRFYDVSSGTVSVNSIDVRQYDLKSLRSQISFVLQKAQLFEGSVRDNVRFGAPGASDEQIWAALETSQAAEFIRKDPAGLNKQLEQGGRNLSGGQRQRLTIARALVRDPAILVLDDSFSALDFSTDAALRHAIRALPGHPTTFLVSQRVPSLRYADRILVLSDTGTLEGCGTHEELLSSCPLYQEICRSQLYESEEKRA